MDELRWYDKLEEGYGHCKLTGDDLTLTAWEVELMWEAIQRNAEREESLMDELSKLRRADELAKIKEHGKSKSL